MYVRITKYNPEYRNKNGAYTKDDWTSISDVGEIFSDKTLTLEEYLDTENAYWNTTKELLHSCHIDRMKIIELEVYESNINDIPSELQNPSKAGMATVEDKCCYPIEQLEILFRLALRELLWCKLIGEDGSYVHFGYDYYLYFGSDRLPDQPQFFAESKLYVEPFISPYLTDNKNSS